MQGKGPKEEDQGGCGFKAIFCPKRYPHSVAKDYGDYQLWDTIQQIVAFVNSHFGQLAVFAFHGVGREGASVARAVFLATSRCLLSRKVKLLGATPQAVRLYCAHVKSCRVISMILDAIGNMMEILAFKANSLAIIWLAPMIRTIGGGMNETVRACILQHFAEERNNADVVLKENNQDKGGKAIGLLGGIVVLYGIGQGHYAASSQTLLVCTVICGLLSLVHVGTNVKAAAVLRLRGTHFVLQHAKTRKYVVVTDDCLMALAEEAEDERVELFKLESQAGKALMCMDGSWFDRAGRRTGEPIRAVTTEDGSSLVMADEIYEMIPSSQRPRLKSAEGGLFWPPGFPSSMPLGYEEYAMYEVMRSLVDSPRALLWELLWWKYVWGVGDPAKSPLYAAVVAISLDAVGLVAGFAAGLPVLADSYNVHWLFPSWVLEAAANFLQLVAAICPFHLFIPIAGLGVILQEASTVPRSAVKAEVERLWAVDPKVDLVHLRNSDSNRKLVFHVLSGLLCVGYMYHLTLAGPAAQPRVEGILICEAALLLLNLAASWKCSSIAAKLVADSNSGHPYGMVWDESDSEMVDVAQFRHSSRTARSSSAHPEAKGLTLKSFASTLLLILTEASLYAGLVTTLSDSTNQLSPCTEECLQFKMFADDSSIPATGIWPFPVKNGQEHAEIVHNCVEFAGSSCELLPASRCASHNTCADESVRAQTQNHLAKTRSKWTFVASIAFYSAFHLANDCGLQAGCLAPAEAITLQALATIALACMAASALCWASGAMELFFSPLTPAGAAEPACGCYYRMGDLSSILALALPFSLVLQLRSHVVQAMKAAIAEVGFLRTVSYSVPYPFLDSAGVDPQDRSALLGLKGAGDGGAPVRGLQPRGCIRLRTAKRLCMVLPLISVTLVLIPLLFSSSFLVYRAADMAWSYLARWLPLEHGGEATLGLFGIYSMIGLQAVVVGYFLFAGLWTLYQILSLQLQDLPNDDALYRRLVASAPELRWALPRAGLRPKAYSR